MPWIDCAFARDRDGSYANSFSTSFFNHYCSWFRAGAFGAAIQQIPMLNMCDDHDIIDGFGSYPDDLQSSAIFSTIGARGFFWFNLFQSAFTTCC